MQVHYLPLTDAPAKAIKMRYISLRSKKRNSTIFLILLTEKPGS
ncbi:hypothetical protein EC12264_A0005 [Escherichia coli 1.2264]|nr:hypothetical protein EC12264_A0005 [Escherichia coli 1.2264]EII20405.1 hypothetical protein EC90111_A0009 [Escherichia coli 9.0111]